MSGRVRAFSHAIWSAVVMRGYDFSWMWQELGVADLRV